MTFRRRRRWPDAPANVRLVHPDGRTHAVELAYAGLHEGLHAWVATSPVPVDDIAGWTVKADEIPARTKIVVGLSS